MANEIVMTKEGYDDLVKELNELKTTRRAEISEKIRVARGFGDLSENSEYDEAKNEQAMVEARILSLEEMLKNVKVLDVEFDEEITYTVVGSTEADPNQFKISDESPVGKALLGARVGETVEVEVPAGTISLKILEISK